jgi:hypothetical protein
MSSHADTMDQTHGYDDEPGDTGLGLPPRPRRRLVTPVTAGLVALLVAAGGFIGGVEVQKGQGQSPAGAASGPAAARFGGGAGGGFAARFGGGAAGGAAAGGVTAGTVAHKRGKVLYVTDSNGKTIKVRTTAGSKVTRNAAASVRGIYPGDTVLVQGKTASSGVVTATRITATSASAASAGGGAGFGPPAGAQGSGG